MVAENQNNPAFLQDIIRMLTQSQSDAGSVHPEDASTAPRPSNTDLLDFSEPHVAPTPEHASATAEPKCKAKPASLRSQRTASPRMQEAEPVEPVPEDNSMPEPPHVRAPWAQLTEELRRTRMAPEPKHAAEPEPGPAPCMYKAPPTGAKFPACRPLDPPHNWPPQEGDPRHQPPLHGFPLSYNGSYWANYWHLGGVPDEATLASAYKCIQHRPGILCQPTHLSSNWMHAYASPRCVCPAPCVAWRCRAADYACCISMTTTASAAACLAQIPHAPMMQYAVSTWSTRPRTRMTGIAAAVVSRTPAISTANAPHAFNRILHRPSSMDMRACCITPCQGSYRHSLCSSTASGKKVTFGQVRSCLQQGHSNQGRMLPTLQVRTDRRPSPHPGRHSNDFFACQVMASLPLSHCRGSIISTDTGSPQAHPCHGAFETAGGLHGQ